MFQVNSSQNHAKSRFFPYWKTEIIDKPLPLIMPDGDHNSIVESRLALEHAERVILRQEERIRQLEDLAMTDELTGIANRRGYIRALEREIAFSCRDPEAAGAVIMIDLDGFKSINDAFGHNAGDQYLCTAANTLHHCIRNNDIVARLGGDEFAVLLTRISRKDADIRLGEMARDFNCNLVEWNGVAMPLRASFGMAFFNGVLTPDQVIAEADGRLYDQKKLRKRFRA